MSRRIPSEEIHALSLLALGIPAKRVRLKFLTSSPATSIRRNTSPLLRPNSSTFVTLASTPKVNSLSHQIIGLPSRWIPALPLTIKVYPSNRSYVTGRDVFHSILNKNVAEYEFSILTEDHRHHAVQAYLQRCARWPTSMKEGKSGMERVDFLMGNSESFRTSQYHPREWQLNIESADTGSSKSSGGLQAPLLPPSENLWVPVLHIISSAPSKIPPLPHPTARKASLSLTLNIQQQHGQLSSASTEPSAHMFEQAHNIVISGGQFYNTAGNTTIDNSQVTDSSIHPANVTHLWQLQYYSFDQVGLHSSTGEQEVCKTGEKEDDSSSCLGDNGTSNDREVMKSCQNQRMLSSSPETEFLYLVVDLPSVLDEAELDNQQKQIVQDIIITSQTTSSIDNTLTDKVIHDILSSFPTPPIASPLLFNRITMALLFSFSPLSPAMVAALLDLNSAIDVRRILLPVHPLVFTPELGDSQDENDDQTPVRFIHSSIVEFFMDRTRSGKYFVDGPTAHRVLLAGSTSVMRKVHEKGKEWHSMSRGWRDAYEYACRNWEAHRRAGTRSKL